MKLENSATSSRRVFLKQLAGAFSIFGFSALFRFNGWAETLSPDLISLRSRLLGSTAEILSPENLAFAKLKAIFNLRLRKAPPLAIVRCTRAEEVSQVVRWAGDFKQKLLMRSGGHSYEGFSSGAGIVLDSRRMNRIVIDETRNTVRVGAGAQLQSLIKALAAKGFALPTGSCPTVGVAGLTLGGGMGLSSRTWGLTCDQLLSVELVLAGGDIVRATATDNSDLFWALRGGGGGNFGVVTEFEFRIRPIKSVYTYVISWPAKMADEALAQWQTYMKVAPTGLNSIFKITGTSNGLSPVKCVGQVIATGGRLSPTRAEVDAMLAPFLRVAGAQVSLRERSFAEAADFFAGGEDPPVRFKAKSNYAYQDLSNEGRRKLIAELSQISDGALVAIFDAYGGRIRDTQLSDSGAFAHRDAQYCVQYYCQWSNDLQEASRLKLMKRVVDAMSPYLSKYSYSNYCDLDTKNWQEAYYGKSYARLVQIKRQVDPHGVFDFGAQSLASVI